jgi:hypothetical protein
MGKDAIITANNACVELQPFVNSAIEQPERSR